MLQQAMFWNWDCVYNIFSGFDMTQWLTRKKFNGTSCQRKVCLGAVLNVNTVDNALNECKQSGHKNG